MDELKYTAKLINGQESGLTYFISKLGHSLRYFAYSIVRDKEIAEEIVSDGFYKLWSGRDKIKNNDSIKSFLYIVIRNACLDHIDKHKNRVYIDENILKDVCSLEKDFLTKIIYIELLEMISLEIRKLPNQQAEIFRLSYLEGLSPDEICKELDTTLNNVYYAKSSALKTLKKVFKEKNLTYYLTLIYIAGV